MTVGTKSLLFGVHQFLWHPFTVWIAWVRLYYEFPTWRECVCIFIHDWGYWGCETMDGADGKMHPKVGARIARRLFGDEYAALVLLHSQTTAKELNLKPSKLCWADKASLDYDPCWFYLIRARLTGEIREYRHNAVSAGVPLFASNRNWFRWLRFRQVRNALRQVNADPAKTEGEP